MRSILKILSFSGLLMTIGPPLFFFNGVITIEENHLLMLIGTVIWFITAPFWINDKVKNKFPKKT